MQDKLFKPFVKQDDSRSSEGSWSWVCNSDSIAKAHVASIEIADDYNGYSVTFVINVPSNEPNIQLFKEIIYEKIYAWEPWFFIFFGLFHLQNMGAF